MLRKNTITSLVKKIFDIVIVFVGCIIFLPLSCLIPKNPKRIAFIGNYDGQFIDNVKYLFIHALEVGGKKYDLFFVTENKDVFYSLKNNGLPIVFHPSLKSLYKLLSANVVIVDHVHWIGNLKFHLLFKSKKVQLWHGVALKKIELALLDSPQFQANPFWLRQMMQIYRLFKGRFPHYNLLISTSPFIGVNVFSNAFYHGTIINTGYPRNDVLITSKESLIRESDKRSISTDLNTISLVKEMKAKGKKIILYAPTFRDSGGNPLEVGALSLDKWAEFAQRENIFLVIKAHSHPDHVFCEQGNSVIYYDPICDVYPFLPISDLLITDYSSIYFDYLFINKPIIFFPYDYQKYQMKDRELYFDYEWITPGPKCYSQEELEREILKSFLSGSDQYQDKRAEICRKTFQQIDNMASVRVWNAIEERYLFNI